MPAVRSMLCLLLAAACSCACATARQPQKPGSPQPPPTDQRTRADRVYKDEHGRFAYDWPEVRDKFLRGMTLAEINTWLFEQWADASSARRFASLKEQQRLNPIPEDEQRSRGYSCSGPVSVDYDPDILTNRQWKTLSQRVQSSLLHDFDDVFENAHNVAYKVITIARTHPEHIRRLNASPLISAAASRLNDEDPQVARQAGGLIGLAVSIPDMNLPIADLIDAAEHTQDQEALHTIVSSIGLYGSEHKGYTGHDERVVRVMLAIVSRESTQQRPRSSAMIALGGAFGAPEQAAHAAVTLLDSPNQATRRLGLLVLKNLCSFWTNPNKASRRKAITVVLPALHRALGDPSAFVLSAACGACRDIAPDLPNPAEFVGDIIPLLNHADMTVRMVAIDAIGYFGEASRPALPNLREMVDAIEIEDYYAESARDAIYMITREGTKPDWYDRRMKHITEALRAGG